MIANEQKQTAAERPAAGEKIVPEKNRYWSAGSGFSGEMKYIIPRDRCGLIQSAGGGENGEFIAGGGKFFRGTGVSAGFQSCIAAECVPGGFRTEADQSSRAREQVVVFSRVHAAQIGLARTGAVGAVHSSISSTTRRRGISVPA